MSVSLNPSSVLGFNRPLTQLVKRVLHVTNNNDKPVAFKVKTTAPKLYVVRPNSGRIEPKESVEVQVVLQAMKEEPPLSVKCKDKFLIQSTIITPEKESMPLHDLWTNVDGEDSQVHQQKIRVNYLPPVGEAVEEEEENLNMSSMMEGKSQFDTVRQEPPHNNGINGASDPAGHAANIFTAEPQPPLERAFSPPVDYSNAHDTQEEEHALPVPVQAPRAPTPVPESILRRATPPPAEVPVHRPSPSPSPPIPIHVPFQSQTTSELEGELRAQLSDAQAEIQRLREMLAARSEPTEDAMSETTYTTDIRRRRPFSDTETVLSSSDTDFGTLVDHPVYHTDGIPPQMVIGISILIFIITYLFF